ncbi:putative NADH-flavin reductase [Lipingzhangella halophila]|uniref:Putative NADH-flavin reductase n=1 Tax=Lipingzhangella halophila TaxID=1783352 RepID=A0A7W7W581_9ACTN|nr:NAD(P)H-binding protein [Lipingzhangella halophila]MBB4934501.1 putative NADH-flavin reductase [Lipingzhangella halophila]
MRLTIFAATGGIGRHILGQALAAGHNVTAAVRDPGKLPDEARGVAVDLTDPDPAAMRDAVAGADAVLSGLGPRSVSDAGITSRGTRTIVRAMRDADVARLIAVSAAPVGTVPSPGRPNPPARDPGDDVLMGYVLGPVLKAILRKHYADLAEMEDALRESELDWTSVRPPRLTDKPLTGTYRTAPERNLPRGYSVPRADVAHFMLSALHQPETVRRAVGVAS